MQNQADFHILGETADYLAVDKPAGLLVHPSKPGGPRTLWDGLRDLLGYELATGGQISIINRLDRETSGVVIVAKSAEAARTAGIAMQRREMKKRYLALVFGWPDWEEITVDTRSAAGVRWRSPSSGWNGWSTPRGSPPSPASGCWSVIRATASPLRCWTPNL